MCSHALPILDINEEQELSWQPRFQGVSHHSAQRFIRNVAPEQK